jgi:hypothetical protein
MSLDHLLRPVRLPHTRRLQHIGIAESRIVLGQTTVIWSRKQETVNFLKTRPSLRRGTRNGS